MDNCGLKLLSSRNKTKHFSKIAHVCYQELSNNDSPCFSGCATQKDQPLVVRSTRRRSARSTAWVTTTMASSPARTGALPRRGNSLCQVDERMDALEVAYTLVFAVGKSRHFL